MHQATILLFVLVSILTAAGQEQTSSGTSQPSVTLPPELARVLRDYEAAWGAKDAARLARLFAEDGYVLPNGAPPARGRAAIENFYTGHGGPLSLRAFAYATEGKVGYIMGGYSGTTGTPDDGKFTLTLRRGQTVNGSLFRTWTIQIGDVSDWRSF